MLMWIGALVIGVVAVVVAAALDARLVHMVIAAIIGALFAGLAIRENRALVAAGARKSRIAAATAQHMGVVWVWGALSLLITYLLIISWREWWQFFLAFAAVGALCLFFASSLSRDADTGREDETMLKLARTLTMVQLAGMGITVLGLLIDGKMTRFLTPRFTDWAGNSIFFFGALALAAISANALLTSREPKAG